MDFLNAIRPLYILSRCLAATPYIPAFYSGSTLQTRIFNILHVAWTLVILSVIMAGFFMCIQDVHVKLTENPGQILSHMFSSPVNFVNSIVYIIIMATASRNKFLRLLEKMCKIDEILLVGNDADVYRKTYRYLIIEILTIFLLLFPFLGYDVYYIWKFSNTNYEVLSRFSVTVSLMLVIQYVNLMNYLKNRLRLLDDHISSTFFCLHDHRMMAQRKFRGWQIKKQDASVSTVLELRKYPGMSSQQMISCVLKYRQQYNEIFEASHLVNSVYGIGILVSTFYSFVSTVNNTYFFFVDTIKNYDKPAEYYTVTHMCWAVVALGKVAIICLSCHSVLDQVYSISHNIQRIQLQEAMKEDVSRHLEKFSYQVSNNNIQFTAFGFFSIKLSFLYTFIASSVTYVIVLIQFNFKSN